MLEKILDKLKQRQTAQAAAHIGTDVKRLAAAALMVEAARRDQDFAADERAAITRIVGEHFHLSPEEAKALVDMAEQRQRLPYGETIFTRAVHDAFTPAERQEVVQMLWEVALADGKLHRLENVMIQWLANEVGLDNAACEAARAAATAARG